MHTHQHRCRCIAATTSGAGYRGRCMQRSSKQQRPMKTQHLINTLPPDHHHIRYIVGVILLGIKYPFGGSFYHQHRGCWCASSTVHATLRPLTTPPRHQSFTSNYLSSIPTNPKQHGGLCLGHHADLVKGTERQCSRPAASRAAAQAVARGQPCSLFVFLVAGARKQQQAHRHSEASRFDPQKRPRRQGGKAKGR